jgi:hypothetical protein
MTLMGMKNLLEAKLVGKRKEERNENNSTYT